MKTVKYPKASTVQLWDFVSEQLYKKSSHDTFGAFAVSEEAVNDEKSEEVPRFHRKKNKHSEEVA